MKSQSLLLQGFLFIHRTFYQKLENKPQTKPNLPSNNCKLITSFLLLSVPVKILFYNGQKFMSNFLSTQVNNKHKTHTWTLGYIPHANRCRCALCRTKCLIVLMLDVHCKHPRTNCDIFIAKHTKTALQRKEDRTTLDLNYTESRITHLKNV